MNDYIRIGLESLHSLLNDIQDKMWLEKYRHNIDTEILEDIKDTCAEILEKLNENN